MTQNSSSVRFEFGSSSMVKVRVRVWFDEIEKFEVRSFTRILKIILDQPFGIFDIDLVVSKVSNLETLFIPVFVNIEVASRHLLIQRQQQNTFLSF